VEVAEAATEGGGRTDGAEESGAGESGADEAGEGGQTEEYLAQEVVAEGEYGGRSGLSGFLLPRRQCTRGHGGGGGAQEATGKEGSLVSAQGGMFLLTYPRRKKILFRFALPLPIFVCLHAGVSPSKQGFV
jgi:hypothetical protein